MEKTIKKALITGLAALVLACQTYKPLKSLRTHLEVKEGAGHAYQITQIDGEYDLNELANTAIKEDSWMYFDNYWEDVGFNEKATTCKIVLDLILNSEKIKNLPEGSKIYWYHIHPVKVSGKDEIYPPSVFDIYAHAVAKSLYKNNLGLNLVSKVFDGYGVWEFEVGKEYNFPLQENFLEKVFFFMDKNNPNKNLSDFNLSREKRIINYTKLVKEIGIILKYEDNLYLWFGDGENK